jgi:hypothetical protein
MKSEVEMKLARLVRSKWGDNGIEYLVGALASVTSVEQLTVLIDENTPRKKIG